MPPDISLGVRNELILIVWAVFFFRFIIVSVLSGVDKQEIESTILHVLHPITLLFTLHSDTLTITSLLPESPFELLLGGAGRGHVDGEQELLEVDVSVLVGVERAEHVVAELLRVTAREEQLVHVHELGRGEAAVGAVLLEALVPLLDGVLVVSGVRLEELEVLLAEAGLALDASHPGVSSHTTCSRQQ